MSPTLEPHESYKVCIGITFIQEEYELLPSLSYVTLNFSLSEDFRFLGLHLPGRTKTTYSIVKK